MILVETWTNLKLPNKVYNYVTFEDSEAPNRSLLQLAKTSNPPEAPNSKAI